MATAFQLDPLTEQLIDDLMASGRFAERADVVRHGITLAHRQQHNEPATLDEAAIAAIDRGLADGEAGRVVPAEQMFDELRQRYNNWQ